jgi:preprotein translocase subunit SecB
MTEKDPIQTHFSIQKIYVKDVSFESPTSPAVFSFKQWDPKIELNINNAHTRLNEQMYEAVLTVTATVKQDDKTAFLIEVQQAGIFAITGFSEQDLSYLIGSQCMNILLPYAREAVSDMTTRGGFPPLLLAPVNFDALYQKHIQDQQAKSAQGAESLTEGGNIQEDMTQEGQTQGDQIQEDQISAEEVVKH